MTRRVGEAQRQSGEELRRVQAALAQAHAALERSEAERRSKLGWAGPGRVSCRCSMMLQWGAPRGLQWL